MSFLGLMTVKKHNEIVRDIQQRRLVALESASKKMASYNEQLEEADKRASELRATIRKLTPDAEKYRRRLAKEREAGQKRRASKAASKLSSKPASKAKAGSK